jgi:hypothetical protein
MYAGMTSRTSTSPEDNGWPSEPVSMERPTMDQMPVMPGDIGVSDGAGYDGTGPGMTSEERIRMLQSGRQNYIPKGTPQTFYQWR